MSIHFDPSMRASLLMMQRASDRLQVLNMQASTGKAISTSRDSPALWAISRTVTSEIGAADALLESSRLQQTKNTVRSATLDAVLRLANEQRGLILAAQDPTANLETLQSAFDDVSAQMSLIQQSSTYQEVLANHRGALDAVMISALNDIVIPATPDDDLSLTGTSQWQLDDGPVSGLPALVQDGVSGDEVTHPEIALSSSVAFGGWVRFDDLGRGSHQRILHLSDGTNTSVELKQFSATNNLVFTVKIDGGGGKNLTASNALTDGEWMHVMATVDSAGYAAIYINGEIAASRTVDPFSSAGTTLAVLNHPTLGTSRNLDGAIANAFVYSDEDIDAGAAESIFNGSYTPSNPDYDNLLTGFTESYQEEVVSALMNGDVTTEDDVVQTFVDSIDESSPYNDVLYTVDRVDALSKSISLAADDLDASLGIMDRQLGILTEFSERVGRDLRSSDISAASISQRKRILEGAQSTLTDADLGTVSSEYRAAEYRTELLQYSIQASIVRWQNILQLFRV